MSLGGPSRRSSSRSTCSRSSWSRWSATGSWPRPARRRGTSPGSTWRCRSAACWAGCSTPWSRRSSSTGRGVSPGAGPGLPGPAARRAGPARSRGIVRWISRSRWPSASRSVVLALRAVGIDRRRSWLAMLAVGVAGGFLCYTLKDRPVRFALGVAAVLLAFQGLTRATTAASCSRSGASSASCGSRTTSRATRTGWSTATRSTASRASTPRRRREPLTYYHRTGPIGQVFEAFGARPARPDVAVVGLGAGSLACYAEPGQRLDLLRDRPGGRADRPRPALLHLPGRLPRPALRRGPGRRPAAAAGRARRRLRPDRPGRLQLRRHPDAPAHARGAAALPRQAGRRRAHRLPHLEPLPRPRPRARGTGPRRGPHRPGPHATATSRRSRRRRARPLPTGS